jgi:hypothetical protein
MSLDLQTSPMPKLHNVLPPFKKAYEETERVLASGPSEWPTPRIFIQDALPLCRLRKQLQDCSDDEL